MKVHVMRDYSRIKYYIDAMGQIWHGPFCQYDNTHYKRVEDASVGHSCLPSETVEITPYQAAQHIKGLQGGYD